MSDSAQIAELAAQVRDAAQGVAEDQATLAALEGLKLVGHQAGVELGPVAKALQAKRDRVAALRAQLAKGGA